MTVRVDRDDMLQLLAGNRWVEVVDIRGQNLSEMVAVLKDTVPHDRIILILNASRNRDIRMDELVPLSNWCQQLSDSVSLNFGIGRSEEDRMQLVLLAAQTPPSEAAEEANPHPRASFSPARASGFD
jgi:hypothetical protein